jgi:uroporphyrinogen-III synthase
MRAPASVPVAVVTRPGEKGQRLSAALRDKGLNALWWPAFDLMAPDDLEPLRALLQRLGQFDLAVFVSAGAVRGLAALELFGQWPAATAIAAPGDSTLQLARSVLPGATAARCIGPASLAPSPPAPLPQAGEGSSSSPQAGEWSSSSPQAAEWSSSSPQAAEWSSSSPQAAEWSSSSPQAAEWSSSSPQAGEGSSSSPQAGKGSSSSPQAGEGSSSSPQAGKGSSSSPQAGKGSSSSPQAGKGSSSSPQAGKGSSSSPQAGKGSSSSPQAGEGSSSSPQAGEGSSSSPQAGKGSSSSPQAGEWSSSSPQAGEWSSSSPQAGKWSSSSPLPLAGEGPGVREPAKEGSEALWEALQAHGPLPRRVLIVRAESGREWLTERLREAGSQVEYASVYRRVVHTPSQEQRAALGACRGAGRVAVTVVTSSEAVAALDRQLEHTPEARAWLREGLALCSHPRIAQALRAAGYARVSECEATAPGVLDAIAQSGRIQVAPALLEAGAR